MYTTVAVLGNIYAVWQPYCIGAYANNLKCIYTSFPSHIVAVSLFEAYIWTCFLILVYELSYIYGMYVAFERHLSDTFSNVVPIYTDYRSSEGEHACII